MSHSKQDTWRIFVDGASRGNPGHAGAGVFIAHNDEVIVKSGFYLGKKTNNQAEYLALLVGLFLIEKEVKKRHLKSLPTLSIHSDSELLVKQMKGQYKVRHEQLLPLKQCASMMLLDYRYTIRHVLRDKNTIADSLANDGIDKKRTLPAAFFEFIKNCDL